MAFTRELLDGIGDIDVQSSVNVHTRTNEVLLRYSGPNVGLQPPKYADVPFALTTCNRPILSIVKSSGVNMGCPEGARSLQYFTACPLFKFVP